MSASGGARGGLHGGHGLKAAPMQPKPFGLSLLEQAMAADGGPQRLGVPLGMCHRRRVGHQPTMRGGLAGRGASQRGRARGLAWWARPEGRALCSPSPSG